MNKKIFTLIVVIILVVLFSIIRITEEKIEEYVNNSSQIILSTIDADEEEASGNLKLFCNNEQFTCTLYDLSESNIKELEKIKTEGTYAPNMIHFGKYIEKDVYNTNDSMINIIEFINDFYAVYTKNNGVYSRTIKANGKDAKITEENEKYAVFQDVVKGKYFLVPNSKNASHMFSLILNDSEAAVLYRIENKKKTTPIIIIYDFKTGKVLKEYSFKSRKNISFEDGLFGNFGNTVIVYNDNGDKYINLLNNKEITVKIADLTYDGYIIDGNKIYDNELNLIKKLNKDEKAIFVYKEKNYEEHYVFLYKKDNIIYDKNNKLIYTLNKGEKYYSLNDILCIYNDKYITKIIDTEGKVLLDNEDNKYNLNTPKNGNMNNLKISFDSNGNVIRFNKDINAFVKNVKNGREVNYDRIILNNYYLSMKKENNNVKYTIYDKELNVYGEYIFTVNEKVESIDFYDLYNGYFEFEIYLSNENKYDIVYIYDLKNNRLFNNKPLYVKKDTNPIYTSIKGYDLLMIASEKMNDNTKLFFIGNKSIKLNNDSKITDFVDMYEDYIIFINEEDNSYLIGSLSKLK